jgi:hypothetical protein
LFASETENELVRAVRGGIPDLEGPRGAVAGVWENNATIASAK